MVNIEEFKKLVNVRIVEKDGDFYCGNLNLAAKEGITELPDNLKVLGSLDLRQSGITKLPKGLEVEKSIDISGTEIEELPEDTKFGLSLLINNMKKPFSFPKVLKVNGYFDCRVTTIKRMPEEVYTKWGCDLVGSTFDKLPKVMEVGEGLFLYDTNTTELPECIKNVYSDFNLHNTKVTKLNENLVVYMGLNLSNTLIEELPKGLIVGGELCLCNTKLKDYSNLHKVCSRFRVTEEKYKEIKDTLSKHSAIKTEWGDDILVTFEPNYKGAYLFENENGKYIKADNIFGKIVEQKGNVYHVKLGKSEDITYLITDGEGRWSHGYTLEKAKDDLIYKITDRDKSDYECLTLDNELSFEDAIVCYRVITGACLFGTRDFIEHRLGENKKDKYTIKEIITLTKGEYGNEEFGKFFCKD